MHDLGCAVPHCSPDCSHPLALSMPFFRMALLCEYSTNGKDLHLNLVVQGAASEGGFDTPSSSHSSPGELQVRGTSAPRQIVSTVRSASLVLQTKLFCGDLGNELPVVPLLCSLSVQALSLRWMDQTSSVVQLRAASATLREVKEELYSRYGLAAAA